MITLDQYFGKHGHNSEHIKNARELLDRVNVLLSDAVKYGVILKVSKKTGSHISGETYGGFRPQDCPIGAKLSSHKEALAVDIFDPDNALDGWLDDIKLLKYNLFREHPEHTKGWVHLTTKPPKSGKRSFVP